MSCCECALYVGQYQDKHLAEIDIDGLNAASKSNKCKIKFVDKDKQNLTPHFNLKLISVKDDSVAK